MKLIFTLLFAVCSCCGFSQKITHVVMADENGITDDIKKAKYLVVLKQYNDTTFERMDYNFAGPMIFLNTYLDADLTILNGRHAEFAENGYVRLDGDYYKNKKEGDWYEYDDTGRIILKYIYHLDTLLSTVNMDSLDRENKKLPADTVGDIDATYAGGTKKIQKIIASNFKYPDRAESLNKAGTVKVRFIVDPNGKIIDENILESVELTFDEESLRVVALLKDWTPAIHKGRKVNAYRIQPITVRF